MNKIITIFKILGALAIISFAAIVIAAATFKTSNPSSPFYDPDSFKFERYDGSRGELHVAFQKLFPLGTPKEFVDRVLIQAGGASCDQDTALKDLWNCRRPVVEGSKASQAVFTLIYDKDMKLLNAYPSNRAPIYPSSVTIEKLHEGSR